MFICITYNEHSSKNCQGGVHQLHLENKSVTHYTNENLGERCFVHLYELHTSKLPQDAISKDLSYCKPKPAIVDDEAWYYPSPVGHNILAHKL